MRAEVNGADAGGKAGTAEIAAGQREYFASGATRPYAFRREMLEKLRRAVRENEELLAEALMSDLHKHPAEGYMCETGFVLEEIGYHLKHLRHWMRERRRPASIAQFPAKCFVSPEPCGTVLIMAPWNYPVQLCLEPLVGAISAGCCAILKPSAYAPETSRAIAKLIGETFPREYIAVVEGGREENRALLEQRFDHIFFTGSVAVGKTVMEAAAKNLTPVTLELGGKSPVIVDRTADLRLAARRILFGKVVNAGQTCVAPDYALVERCVRDALIDEMRAALKAFFPDGHGDMVHIISEKHYARRKELLAGQCAAIGGGFDDERRFIEPTVLIDVDESSPIMREEIFAPVLPVLTWERLDEAIDFIRRREKPLALYLFTASAETERRVLDSCSFGGGCINDTIVHLATPRMGFGGVGSSGMGQYHGKKSFDTFSHERSIAKRSTRIDLPVRYFPYKAWKDRAARKLMK